jgi:hypothetical protein
VTPRADEERSARADVVSTNNEFNFLAVFMAKLSNDLEDIVEDDEEEDDEDDDDDEDDEEDDDEDEDISLPWLCSCDCV